MSATLARQILRRAGFAPPCQVEGGMITVAANLLLDADFFREAKRGPSLLMFVGGRPKIVTARGLGPKALNFEIARMVARLELQRAGKWSARVEDRLARHLVVESVGHGWLPMEDGFHAAR